MTKKKAVKKASKKAGKKAGAKSAGKKSTGKCVNDSGSSSSSSSTKKSVEMTPKKTPKVTTSDVPFSPVSSMKTPRNNEDSLEGESNQVKRVQWNLVASAANQILAEKEDLKKANDKLNECVAKDDFKSNAYKHWKEQVTKLDASIQKLEDREASYRKSAENEQARRVNTSSRGFMLKGTVPDGFSYGKYKGNLYKSAANLQGYSMKCEYEKTGISDLAPEGQLTSNSNLNVELYFETKERAVDMCNKWEKHHKRFDLNEMKPVRFELQEAPEDFNFDFNQRVKERDYDDQDTPKRTFAVTEAQQTESIPSHTRVTKEQVEYESLMDHSNDQFYALKSCHILEKRACKGNKAYADNDPANRLFMNGDLHSMYDELNLLSVTSEQTKFKKNDDQRCPVTLHLCFKTPELAIQYFSCLRSPTLSAIDSCVIAVTITHTKPSDFVKYLVERHNRNMQNMQVSDSVSVNSQQNLDGCEEEGTEEN